MTFKDVLSSLEAHGTEQNRKIYARHGISPPLYGVSYAHLKTLQRSLKTNQSLAEQLWKTGNHDARILACQIADPQKMTASLIKQWLSDLSNYSLTDAFTTTVAATPFAARKMNEWIIHSKKEWVGRAGWLLVAHWAMKTNPVSTNEDLLQDSFFEEKLRIIGDQIHQQPNRTKDAMNSALIAIGIRNKNLLQKALKTAKFIGKVHVDHGQTSCKTPDATTTIQKTMQHRKRKKHIGC